MTMEVPCSRDGCHSVFRTFDGPAFNTAAGCYNNGLNYLAFDSDFSSLPVCVGDNFLNEDDLVDNKYLQSDIYVDLSILKIIL